LESGAIKGCPREGSIIVFARHKVPALMGLAFNICLAGFALSIERVKREIEIIVRGFAGINGAALS
jgi:hypothetical protein